MDFPASQFFPQKNTLGNLTLQHVRILLDEIPSPCLLIKVSTGKIMLSNSTFSEFTHFPVSEIIGADINSYSRGIDLNTWGDGFIGSVYLKRRNSTDLETQAKLSYIDKTNEIALISFTYETGHHPINNAMKIFLKHQTNLWNKWEDLSIKSIIEDLRNVIHDLFNPEELIFYLPNGKESELYRYEKQKDEFPENLLSIEITRIGDWNYWEPGKRVLTEIHRAGRSAHYRSILCFSFDWYNLGKGLGVLAFRNPIDMDLIKELLSGLSEWISSVTKQFQKIGSINEKTEELKTRNKILEAIFRTTNDAIVILNRQGEIVHFNDNFCKLFSYSPIELLNNKWEIFFGDETQTDLQNSDGFQNQSVGKDISPLIDRNGKQIPVTIKSIKFGYSESHNLLILQSAADKIAAQDQKQSLEKKAALGEVVADFAHEVRNPVNNISTGLQLILQDLSEEDENLQVINRMQEDCIRINYLMESILSFSRQDSKQFRELDLYQLLKRISYQLINKFEQKGHELKFTCELDSAVILGDQRSIEQVVINLANNSSDALGDKSGIIGLKLEESEKNPDYYVVTVSDTGPGIPSKVEERLFEPFVSDKPKGTGLGLAIAKRIVESHGGFINVQTFPGGTIFDVILPKKFRGDQQ